MYLECDELSCTAAAAFALLPVPSKGLHERAVLFYKNVKNLALRYSNLTAVLFAVVMHAELCMHILLTFADLKYSNSVPVFGCVRQPGSRLWSTTDCGLD